MEAKEKSFSFMESESLIEIPFFQRPYVWKRDQWEQLYADLHKSFEEKREHFLGSIVLKQLPSSAGDGTRRSLIDGQQRLTTFSIMVKALYDLLDNDDKADYAKYLFKKPTKEKNPKIQHSKFDREAFGMVLCSENFKSLKEEEKANRLLECYEFFSKRVQELSDPKAFLDYICESNLWVTINLGENEDEQKIFDSLNTSGLKLTAMDVIKNAIFAKASNLNLDCERLYHEYWESTFEGNSQKVMFWERVIATGRIQRTEGEIFLHAFAVLKEFFDSDKHTLENLSLIYKEYLENYTSENFEDFLKEIKKYADVYRDFPIINDETSFVYEKYEERFFHLLYVANVSTVLPLILMLKTELKEQPEEYEAFLVFLECLILYRWITKDTTKQYNKFFPKCIRDLKGECKLEKLKQVCDESDFVPKEDDVKYWLMAQNGYGVDDKRAKFILFWIELHRRYSQKNMQDVIELQNRFTLEHLFPQNFVPEEWGYNANINRDDLDEYVRQIGNLTLLKGSLNSSISNNSWKIKLKGDGSRKNCLEKCADLLITREVLNYDEWNQNTIKERSQRLINEFFKIWNLEK